MMQNRTAQLSMIPALLAIGASYSAQLSHPPIGQLASATAAYEERNFAEARIILRPMVYDHAARNNHGPNPWAALYLAKMTLAGEGAMPDKPLACALFRSSVTEFMMWIDGPTSSGFRDGRAGVDEACGPLVYSSAEQGALDRGAFLDGLVPSSWELGSTHRVSVDRLGIHVFLDETVREFSLPDQSGGMFLPIRETDLEMSHRDPERRHFLNFFIWVSYPFRGHVTRELHWRLLEVSGLNVVPKLDLILDSAVDTSYPDWNTGRTSVDAVDINPGEDDAVAWRYFDAQTGQLRLGTFP